MNAHPKVTARHLDRAALVYVRQSSMMQVRDHTESTARQYALAERAVGLGWPRTQVTVIDHDLGLSGRSAEHRPGLRDLIARVCLGEVGAIVVLEVSRLARSHADFQRLLDFARLADTLLIDSDGVYDLRDFNDRLVLGLKGSMSEAELHLMAGRLLGGQRSAAARGELRIRLPVGYRWDDEGRCVIEPDEEVRTAVADLFHTFAVVGSAYGVVGAFAGRRFPSRVIGGPDAGQLCWERLTHIRAARLLANPVYAGAYAYGRRSESRRLAPDGTVHVQVTRHPRDQWQVLLRDHHPGYITWDEHLAICERLAANNTARRARPPREGTALCQGIIFCGSCGNAMYTRYHDVNNPIYQCNSALDQQQLPTCRSVTAAVVDQAVAELLLAALTPAEAATTLAAAAEVARRHSARTRAAELAVERARYQADRAARAYHACEPENRLVARTLETRWEERLRQLSEAETQLAIVEKSPVLPDPAAVSTLLGDVHALWNRASTTPRDRKRLLRTLIADVTLLPQPDRHLVTMGVRWHTGATDTLTRERPRAPRTPDQAMRLIRELAPTTHSGTLAQILNDAGHRTAHGQPFTTDIVNNLRHDNKIPSASPPPGSITVKEAAARLGISTGTIYDWIHAGRLPAQRQGTMIHITWSEATEETWLAHIARTPRIKHNNPNTPTRRAV